MNATRPFELRPHAISRVVGMMSLGISAMGLIQLIVNVVGYRTLGPSFINEQAPFMTYGHRFALMSAIALFLLIPLGLAGILLLRQKPHAVLLSQFFFVIEIPVFVWILRTWNLPFLFFSPPIIACGLMNGGIAIQIVTAYPVLCFLLLARAKGRAGGTH